MANVTGRLAEVYTCMSPCTQLTDEGFSYSAPGDISDIYESTPHSGGYYYVSAQYWANRLLKQISRIPGLPTITYNPDGEGRAYQVSASSGQNPVTITIFNAASFPTSVTYGLTDSDSFSYDPNTGSPRLDRSVFFGRMNSDSSQTFGQASTIPVVSHRSSHLPSHISFPLSKVGLNFVQIWFAPESI